METTLTSLILVVSITLYCCCIAECNGRSPVLFGSWGVKLAGNWESVIDGFYTLAFISNLKSAVGLNALVQSEKVVAVNFSLDRFAEIRERIADPSLLQKSPF